MQIEYLADHPLLVPRLAAMHFEQWGYLRPDESMEHRTGRLEAYCYLFDAKPADLVAL